MLEFDYLTIVNGGSRGDGAANDGYGSYVLSTKDDRREMAFARRAQAHEESQAAAGHVRLIWMGYDRRVEQGRRGGGVFHRTIGTDQQPPRAAHASIFPDVLHARIFKGSQGGLEIVIPGRRGGQEASAAKDILEWKFECLGNGTAGGVGGWE